VIKGTVTTCGLPNYKVTISVSNERSTVDTNPKGEFSFPDVRPGCHLVTARLGADTKTLQVTATGEQVIVDFALDCNQRSRFVLPGGDAITGKIKGRVSRRGGASLNRTVMVRFLPDSGVKFKPAGTNKEGDYESDWLDLGVYTVMAEDKIRARHLTVSDAKPVSFNFTVDDCP
jgi:hypothetical protein